MTDDALQRTIRRVGAVVVLAVGTLSMMFTKYVQYQGYPLGIWRDVALLLVGGAVLYLVVSLLVGAAARVDGQLDAEPAGGRDPTEDAE